MSFSLFPPRRAHFMGIGGIGMSGVAHLLQQLSWQVDGCDCSENEQTRWLRSHGIPVHNGHSGDHLSAAAPVVFIRTPAVPEDHPELQKARALGFPVFSRGEVLAAISHTLPTIAVCGSHGKTTTSSYLASLLHALRPGRTAWCIGGVSPLLSSVSGFGKSIRKDAAQMPPLPQITLVAEADESDGTLALYTPSVTVLTNVDYDHVDRFKTPEAFEEVFQSVLSRTSGQVVFCADDPAAARLVSAIPEDRLPRLSFGTSPEADYHIRSVETPDENKTIFSLRLPGGRILNASLPVPGIHNVRNAVAAIAAAALQGIPEEEALAFFAENAKLPARRFECSQSPRGFRIITDYAHHPSEIKALLESARHLRHRRLIGIFQPHRYTRTQTLKHAFPPAFEGLDELLLCPVYAASEPPLPGGTAADLYAEFRRQPSGAPAPLLASSLDDALHYVLHHAHRDDIVLLIGAGDIHTLAPHLREAVATEPEPVIPAAPPPRSGYGTTAPVPCFYRVSSREELRRILSAMPPGIRPGVVGALTNTLISDCGFYAPLLQLSPAGEFSFIREENPAAEDSAEIFLRVGAATPGSRLLAFCREKGFSGLEALTQIPGSVGGWLAMNAGTRDGAFCDCLCEARVFPLAPDTGTHTRQREPAEITRSREELAPRYRDTPGLRGTLATEVLLRLRRTAPEEVAAKMQETARKRFDFGTMRTCGSVFKNPEPTQLHAQYATRNAQRVTLPQPPAAGKLSEEAGCKGLRVGSAYVCERHGNIIAMDSAALPARNLRPQKGSRCKSALPLPPQPTVPVGSDVVALVEIVRARVAARSGIFLSPEVRLLHGMTSGWILPNG